MKLRKITYRKAFCTPVYVTERWLMIHDGSHIFPQGTQDEDVSRTVKDSSQEI